eukprot:12914978-Prorocentrum_lima.AAC.1
MSIPRGSPGDCAGWEPPGRPTSFGNGSTNALEILEDKEETANTLFRTCRNGHPEPSTDKEHM